MNPRAWRGVGVVVAVAGAWGILWLIRPTGSSLPVDTPSPATSSPAVFPSPTQPGVAALHGFGESWVCPFAAPYRAYEDHQLYPPNHPWVPGEELQPERCFRSLGQGMLAGYAVVPPPSGAVLVDGVYLQPVDATYWDSACQRAAGRVGFPVPCPGRLPNMPVGETAPRCRRDTLSGRDCVLWDRAFAFEQEGFATPPGYRGGPSGGGPKADLTIAAYRKVDVDRLHDLEYLFDCPGAPTEGTVEILGPAGVWSADVLACPFDLARATLLIGDTILRWEVDGIVYIVAVAGDDDTTVLLAKAIAGNLRIVEVA